MSADAEEGFLIEFHAIGNQVKVSAFDTPSSTEVSIIVPRNTPQHYAASLAIQKLQFILAKNNQNL